MSFIMGEDGSGIPFDVFYLEWTRVMPPSCELLEEEEGIQWRDTVPLEKLLNLVQEAFVKIMPFDGSSIITEV